MKLNITKQSMLKGFLLLALVANLSWRPALRSLDLASETGTSTKTAPPAAKEEEELKKAEDVKKFCSRSFHISYSETKVKDTLVTEIVARPQTGKINDFTLIRIRVYNGLDINFKRDEVRKEHEKDIRDKVKSQIEARGGKCKEDSDDDEDLADKKSDDDKKKDDATKEKDRIKQGVAACKMNSRGKKLTERESVRCKLQKLSQIDGDTPNEKRRAMQKIESLVADVKKSIKARLTHKNDDEVEEGEELLTELVDTLKDLSSELRLDPSRMQRMISGLQGMRAGGDLYRRSKQLDEDVKDARSTMREEYLLALQDYKMNPRDPVAAQRLLTVQREMLQQQSMMRAQMNSELGPSWTSLVQAMRTGGLSGTDFNFYTQPLGTLNQDLNSMIDTRQLLPGATNGINPNMGGLGSNLPADYQDYRRRLNPRTGGAAAPAIQSSTPESIFNQQNMFGPSPQMGGRRMN